MALAELSPVTVSHRDLMALPNCDADGSVVRLRGEHDFYTAPRFGKPWLRQSRSTTATLSST